MPLHFAHSTSVALRDALLVTFRSLALGLRNCNLDRLLLHHGIILKHVEGCALSILGSRPTELRFETGVLEHVWPPHEYMDACQALSNGKLSLVDTPIVTDLRTKPSPIYQDST